MFENLTKYLPELEKTEGHAKWAVDRSCDGMTPLGIGAGLYPLEMGARFANAE